MGTTAWMQELEQRMEQLPRGDSRNPSNQYPYMHNDKTKCIIPSIKSTLPTTVPSFMMGFGYRLYPSYVFSIFSKQFGLIQIV